MTRNDTLRDAEIFPAATVCENDGYSEPRTLNQNAITMDALDQFPATAESKHGSLLFSVWLPQMRA
jgi:hypothetical protein